MPRNPIPEREEEGEPESECPEDSLTAGNGRAPAG